jgi:ADP-heptose:LPS heptosyltransferase
MHLLFISSNRIGDSLINLQVLNKYIRKNKKEIEITLVSGELPLPLYDDYSMITNRIILKKEKYNLHWWKLYKKLSPLKFDEIVDFRSSLISYFLRTKKRNIFKMNKKKKYLFTNPRVI